jgi:hypothetical protein
VADKDLEKVQDFDAFQDALGVDAQRATSALGRLARWTAQKG